MAEPIELAQIVAQAQLLNEGFATANGTKPGTPEELYTDASSLLSYAFVYASMSLVSSGSVLVHDKAVVMSMQIVSADGHDWVTAVIGKEKKEFAIDLSALQYPDVRVGPKISIYCLYS
jgi:hypothetical protein